MKTLLSLQPLLLLLASSIGRCNAALSQSDEGAYLANFDAMQAASYAVADGDLPFELDVCKNDGLAPSRAVTVQAPTGIVDSATVAAQCGIDSVCTIPIGTTWLFDSSANLGALVVQGAVEWTDETQVSASAFLCTGYVAVEGQGSWEIDLQEKDAFIFIKDNGAIHHHLRSRAFGSYAATASDYPIIDIKGRELVRTWSLLSDPLQSGDDKMNLMHNAHLMGWRVGDRIGIAPTERRATGYGETFTIAGIDDNGSLLLDKAAQYDHAASFLPGRSVPALMSAEVVLLSRNVVITGDDFKHVPCDPTLPEAVFGEQTSVLGCRCSSFRSQCTIGLHTAAMHGGSARIQNTRIERCGQRGIEGKYCLHFHKLHDCPTCLFKNNAIEGSHQRGIIVHSTHSSTVEANVLYDVRGAGIYIEDGNEMFNEVRFNVVICPFAFYDGALHGCTVPGTSGRIADTSDNQSGVFSRAATNSLTGNRVSNAFNGMLLKAGSIGRGESYDKVCESAARLGRYEGNTFHGNGRFGTYTLGFNYPKATDQSILTNGHMIDKQLCKGFDSQGYDTGLPGSFVNGVDYNNAFVGHYEAGDIQHNGHFSYENNNLLYWKETKAFQNGCSAHLAGATYARGNVALPDQTTFLIEDTTFGPGTSFEAGHHCNVGSTGVLCFPTYMLHNVRWKNADTGMKWIWFQWQRLQQHANQQQFGGTFTLSPPDAQTIMDGGTLEHSIFPPGFVSLVSSEFTYLLFLPGEPCILSTDYGQRYDGGILCKVPLRALKIYSRGQFPGSAPNLVVEIWYNRSQEGPPDRTQSIGFHQTGASGPKQGYALPVIPSTEHHYRLSLASGSGDIPSDWVVEFSDTIVGNRFSIEYINLSLNGRLCGQDGRVSSQHDRRFIWSGDILLANDAWGNTGACANANPPDFPTVDCSAIDDGLLPATECPELCGNTCDDATSYCDCGLATCEFKPGFTITADLCWAAQCGEHGSCAATYLGGELPVSSRGCICRDGFSGTLCEQPPSAVTYCGCETCSEAVWNAPATDSSGSFSCGSRITWLLGNGYDEAGACDKVAAEFPGLCTCDFDCAAPVGPSSTPSKKPTALPSVSPSQRPTQEPSPEQLTRYCNCQTCTEAVWNTPATDSSGTHSCGGRITWLQNVQGYSEPDACEKVTAEFPDICTCNFSCATPVSSLMPSKRPTTSPSASPSAKPTFQPTEPPTLVPTRSPSKAPSKSPLHRPTALPTGQPSPSPISSPVSPTPLPTQPQSAYCGCSSCTDAVWNSPVTDRAGSFTCGQRIVYLQSDLGMSVYDSCKRVGEEFPSGLCGPTCSPCNPQLCNAARLEDPDPSKLVWSDEFDVDGAPDPTRWTYDLGDGCNIGLCNWGNGEVAYYTSSPANVVVANGVLKITAKKESGFSLPYTSARLVTRGLATFKYGRVQFRASLATCQAVGTWPALWMLPEEKIYGGWPDSGEIDVMEAVGHEVGRFFGTVHTTNFNGMIGTQKGSSISACKGDWHVFEINWEEDRIQFAVDGEIYFEYLRESSVDWPFDQDFHLIMNVAVGGAWGGAQGIDMAAFEGEGQSMEVDWVRVYSDAPQPSAPCGCEACSLDAVATDGSGTFTCGARIDWLQINGYDEAGACAKVASEFPDICDCGCIVATPAPTPLPTDQPTNEPTASPIVTYCGCATCTQTIWDTMATDAGGSYSCGGRITWLQNAQGYNEPDACEKVGLEFPDICPCNPTLCSNLFG
ncbi:hypothetical protein ACHAXT_008559 [Thalassiosira profunda]